MYSFVTLTVYFIFRFTDADVFFETLNSGTRVFSENEQNLASSYYQIFTEKRG